MGEETLVLLKGQMLTLRLLSQGDDGASRACHLKPLGSSGSNHVISVCTVAHVRFRQGWYFALLPRAQLKGLLSRRVFNCATVSLENWLVLLSFRLWEQVYPLEKINECIPFVVVVPMCLSVYFVFHVYFSEMGLCLFLSLESKSILCLLSKLNKYKMKLMLEFIFVSLCLNAHLCLFPIYSGLNKL